MSQVSDAVEPGDVLFDCPADLPPPAERAWLRVAGELTQEEVAQRLGVKRLAVIEWESGRAEPRKPHRQAYARLLKELAANIHESSGRLM